MGKAENIASKLYKSKPNLSPQQIRRHLAPTIADESFITDVVREYTNLKIKHDEYTSKIKQIWKGDKDR